MMFSERYNQSGFLSLTFNSTYRIVSETDQANIYHL